MDSKSTLWPVSFQDVDILSLSFRSTEEIGRFEKNCLVMPPTGCKLVLTDRSKTARWGESKKTMALVRASLPLGIVIRKTPGITRWAAWAWKVVAVLPGAGPAQWRELRRDGDAVEYHASTLELVLFSTDTEGYLVTLAAKRPGIAVVLRDSTDPKSEMPYEPVLVTASAYEGQDYMDSGDGLIELVPMPEGLVAWIRDFVDAHHVEEPFIKRKRDRKRVDLIEDGKGDARVRQDSDVFRAPRPANVGDA